eukprot:GHVP01036610.1.p1 GENE.GHVP01036610.1~~GHVP01036610.1.p1  ORF type:complete len:155 (-),score=1.13 GHVP01036610.1:11-475(-)
MSRLGNSALMETLYPRRDQSKAPAALRRNMADVNTTTLPLSARSSRTQSDDTIMSAYQRTNMELTNPFTIISPHVRFHSATNSPSAHTPPIATPYPVKSGPPTEANFMTTEPGNHNTPEDSEFEFSSVPASSSRNFGVRTRRSRIIITSYITIY